MSAVFNRKSLETQVREISDLVSDATRALEQIAYALQTLAERLAEEEPDDGFEPRR